MPQWLVVPHELSSPLHVQVLQRSMLPSRCHQSQHSVGVSDCLLSHRPNLQQSPKRSALFSGSVTWNMASSALAHISTLTAFMCDRSRRRGRSNLTQCRATATAVKKKIKKRVDQKEEDETKTRKDMWAVLVHAPIRNCRMPWCKIPGLRRVICTCLKDGVEPPTSGGASIRSKDGKCALTVQEYAEVLAEGVPVLSRSKAYEVSSKLFESALVNDVGTAMVIGAFKKAAEEYQQKLTNLGLWVSITPVDRE